MELLSVIAFLLLLGNQIECKSVADIKAVAQDTGVSDFEALSAELDSIGKEGTSDNEAVNDVNLDDERREAIESGTFTEEDPNREDERREAIDSGTFTDADEEDTTEEEERKEAIESGTYTEPNDVMDEPSDASPGNSVNENDSWLPSKTSITDEIYFINKADNASGLEDLDVMPDPDDEGSNDDIEKRNALRSRAKLWRDRVVHYKLDSSLNSKALKWIRVAISEFNAKTCIKFKELTSGSKHYIKFFKGGGCYSYIGKVKLRNKNFQDVSIGSGCEHKGIVIHELMHAIGFFHEQSRYDRDNYVWINFTNIRTGKERNFKKYTKKVVTGLGLPYDYDGVMHYGAYAFARNRAYPTIVKIGNAGGPIGQRKGFSKTDLEQINSLYDCKTDSTISSWSRWSRWSSCFDAGNGRKEHSQRFCFRENLSECPGANRYGTQLRERDCRGGTPPTSKVTTISTQATQSTQPTKPSTGSSINEPICGTRATLLAHPVLNPQNIVGGQHALPGDWPWQVGIASRGSTFVYCGGTLISSQWVVSAAHCFQRGTAPSRITARLGEHNRQLNEGNEQVITLSKVFNHPLYNKKTLDYDIAVLKLSRPVKYTKYIRPACVPPSGFKVDSGKEAFVSGWGKTAEGGSSSPVLQVAKVPIISNANCGYGSSRLTSRMLCAGKATGGVDSCQGDSGGPLVLKDSKGKFDLIGVVSWGIGCARPNLGGVYARVSALRSFIDSVLASTPAPPPTTSPAIGKPDLLTCSFQNNLCNWKQSRSDKFDWTRKKGKTPSSGTGPSQSSTGASDYYLYIETSYPRTNGDTATLISPEIRPSASSCLSFKAHMYGSGINTLKIDRIQGIIRQTLLKETGNKGNKWSSYEVNLPAGGPYKIEITGTRGKDFRGDIAIDELKWKQSACYASTTPMPTTTTPELTTTAPKPTTTTPKPTTSATTAPTPAQLRCTFEKNLCNWKQSKSDNFDWTRKIGKTPSFATGPSQSSTGKNGYYLYIESSSPRKNGDKATLISPDVSSVGQSCLSFKAHMYGSTINTLSISMVEGGRKTMLLEITGNQGNKWYPYEVDLPSGGPYKVEITGIRGRSFTGDIAIDELKWKSSPCYTATTAATTTSRPTTLPTTVIPSVALLTCTLKKNLCNWKQSKADTFDWTRKNGRTPSFGTGPSQSSTGQNGYYLYIETSYPRTNGDTATLISPDIRSSVSSCFSFKAHMYGSDITTLRVAMVQGGIKTTIFELTGNKGNKWSPYEVNLPAGGPYKIEITGIRGEGYQGDIAIDALKWKLSPCRGGVATTPTQTTKPASCGKPMIPGQRVIGGVNATRGSWPWQILLLYRSIPMCGGTLVTPSIVVTAAHCVYKRGSSSFKVRVGEYNIKTKEGSEVDLPVERIVWHAKYSRATIDYDIAVIKLRTPATLGKYVQTACLPALNEEPTVGSNCYITGFGKIKHPGKMHNILQQAKIRVVSKKDCIKKNTAILKVAITDRMICAGNGPGTTQSGCHGDSGGPFVCKKNGAWYLQGAVSWGSGSCSASLGYTVFAKTANKDINEWIKKQITSL